MNLVDDLGRLVQDLEYVSETDAAVSVVVLEAGEGLPWEGGDLPVRELAVDLFFRPLRDTDAAAAWHAVHTLLAGSLTQLAYYRVGEISLDLYVLGTEPATGRRVGIHTHAVET